MTLDRKTVFRIPGADPFRAFSLTDLAACFGWDRAQLRRFGIRPVARFDIQTVTVYDEMDFFESVDYELPAHQLEEFVQQFCQYRGLIAPTSAELEAAISSGKLPTLNDAPV